jgi:hypothetical protein
VRGDNVSYTADTLGIGQRTAAEFHYNHILAFQVKADFGFQISDFGFQIPDSRFQIPDSRFQIPDFGVYTGIPGQTSNLVFVSHNQRFLKIQNQGAFFACLRQAKNRAIRSNLFGAPSVRQKVFPLLSLARLKPQSGLPPSVAAAKAKGALRGCCST